MSVLKTIGIQHLNGSSPNIQLDSSGNVGVGTVPTNRLHVYHPTTTASATVQAGTNGLGNVARINLVAGTSGVYNFGLYVADNGHGLAFYDYGQTVERMRIDGSGRVTKPYQPAFLVGFPGFNTTSTPAIVPTGGTLAYNIGSNFNTSTMRFTAPVAGLYLFYAAFLRSSSAVVFRANFFKNGSFYSSQYRTTEGFTGYNETSIFSCIVQCSLNDIVDFRIASDSNSSIYNDSGALVGGNYNHVGGYLLG
jgi:hypothetical protein